MTVYIFEDHKSDALSFLFRGAYPESITSQFRYAEGNGNLARILNECLVDSAIDSAIVYIDVIPGNLDTRRIYFNLKKLAAESDKPVVILPILCAEYYFLKAFRTHPIVKNQRAVDYCLALQGYDYADIIVTERDFAFCTSFEKYCKLVQLKALGMCANAVGVYGRSFYTIDCEHGDQQSIENKSRKLLCSYPCVPKLDSTELKTPLQEIIDNFVILHNSLCDTLRAKDPANASKYKYIH